MSPDRPTLLVADDLPENLRLFSLLLGKVYRVETAASGEAVLERLRAGGIDAALLDLNYGGRMTGFDVVAAIRADPALAHLPAAALTAHASADDRTRCLGAGFDAYLAKPVSRADLLATAEALLAKAPGAR